MDILERAEEATTQPGNSAWYDDRLFGRPWYDEKAEEWKGGWGLTPFSHYDSDDELQEANYRTALDSLREQYPDDADVVGVKLWVGSIRLSQVIVRVFYPVDPSDPYSDVDITPAFVQVAEWVDALETYPVLDDDALSEVEYERFCEALDCWTEWRDLTEEQANRAFQYLREGDVYEVEQLTDELVAASRRVCPAARQAVRGAVAVRHSVERITAALHRHRSVPAHGRGRLRLSHPGCMLDAVTQRGAPPCRPTSSLTTTPGSWPAT